MERQEAQRLLEIMEMLVTRFDLEEAENGADACFPGHGYLEEMRQAVKAATA